MARPEMPWKEPEGWQARRRSAAWGVFFLTIIVALFTQWLAQIIGGAIVGAVVGLEGLSKITTADFNSLNQLAWWSSGIITVFVTGYAVLHVREDLTWSDLRARLGNDWGIGWWPNVWRPILLGTALHGVAFSVSMFVATMV